MRARKYSMCEKPAFAFRIETDGAKTYLCLKHLPEGEATYHCHWEKLERKREESITKSGEAAEGALFRSPFGLQRGLHHIHQLLCVSDRDGHAHSVAPF